MNTGYIRKISREFIASLKCERQRQIVRRAIAGRTGNLDDIVSFIVSHPARMQSPLIVISQVRRSGGTLLNQLFDGHSSLAAYPHDIKIGAAPDGWNLIGPELGPSANFKRLFDANSLSLMKNGYAKVEREDEPFSDRFRFLYVPRVQHALFRHLFEIQAPASRREVLNQFFQSYFNAWLDYQGKLEEKQWVTGFALRLANYETTVSGFFLHYPDGLLIQLIREPMTWYVKERSHSKSKRASPQQLLEMWSNSAESILRNKSQYGDQVIVLCFEDLIGKTERTMRVLARTLDIDYEPTLLYPTFNGNRLPASHRLMEEAVDLRNRLMREKILSDDECRLIETCSSLYERVAGCAVPVAP